MGESVTSATFIHKLGYSLRCKLSDFLDPQDRWRDVLVSIRRPDGGFRYSQHHVRRFEGLKAQGSSPTVELLADWGTSGSTVGELVHILRSNSLFAAADLLLPGGEHDEPLTWPIMETQRAPPGSDQQPTVQLQSCSDQQPTAGLRSFLYSHLISMTANFDKRPVSSGGRKLGEGGFGAVFKGHLTDRPVAVKKLNPVDGVSLEELQLQFNQEIETLKVLKHENLVDLLGFSCDGQSLCLVYPYMANGSLLDRLSCSAEAPPLSWKQRCWIAEGAASGLEYLHINHHVHRDVKSANILLDENLQAKISDFGLTRASPKQTSTTVMTEKIVGTCAYMAPEALRGEVTPKSDVFSFGVVLLEILSGLPPADDKREPQFLMDMRHDIDDEDEDLTLEAFVDRRLSGWDMAQVETMYSLACRCLQERRNRRPLIAQVLSELSSLVRSLSLDCSAQG